MKQRSNEFQFSATEVEYLKQLLSKDEAFAGLLRSQKTAASGKIGLCLSRSEAEQVRDRLTTALAERGFDETYSPNNLGRMIEALIDRLYVP